jgi:hypothetical protein
MREAFRTITISDALIYVCVSITTVCLPSFIYLSGPFLDIAFSSDILLPASLHWNMTHRVLGWFTFEQPRVMGLLPDQAVYHLLAFIFRDPRMTALAYAITMLGAFQIIAALCVQRLCQIRFTYALLLFCVIFNLLATAIHLTGDRYIVYNLILLPVTHSGTFLLSLLLFLSIKPGQTRPSFLQIALCFAGCLSDPLFLLYGVGAYILSVISRISAPTFSTCQTALQPYLRAVIAALAGYNLPGILFIQKTNKPILPDVYKGLLLMRHDSARLTPNNLLIVIGLICLGALLIYLWRLNPADRLRQPLAFICAAMALPLSIFIFFYHDDTCVRYLLPLFLWPVIGLTAWASHFRSRLIEPAAMTALTLVVAASVMTTKAVVPSLAWRSSTDQCLDAISRDIPLKAGLAGYDLARPVTMSSGFQRQVEQITLFGDAYLWGNDPYWFIHDLHAARRAPDYNFILTDHIVTSDLLRIYGAPDRVRKCPQTEVWIYNQPLLDKMKAVSGEALGKIR